jgi:hypothetical protein
LAFANADRGTLLVLGSRGRGVGTFSPELRRGTFCALASDHKPITARDASKVPARKRRVMTISPRFERGYFVPKLKNV